MKAYFDRFFEEKDLQHEGWLLIAKNGTGHIIDSDVVIEQIKAATPEAQDVIRMKLIELDFANAPIMPFLKFLAGLMVEMHEEKTR